MPVDAATTGDFGALVIAAANVVQNAVRHSPSRSAVRVSSGSHTGYASLTVEDAVPGIPASDVSRLRRPFQRGGIGGGGAGLGLVIVTAQARELHLSTTPLSGLRAELCLPVAWEESRRQSPSRP